MNTANDLFKQMMKLPAERGIQVAQTQKRKMTWEQFEEQHPIIATILMYIGKFFVSAFFVAMLMFGYYLTALGI